MVLESMDGTLTIFRYVVTWGNQLILDLHVFHFVLECHGGLVVHAMIPRFETPGIEVCGQFSEGIYNLLVTYVFH